MRNVLPSRSAVRSYSPSGAQPEKPPFAAAAGAARRASSKMEPRPRRTRAETSMTPPQAWGGVQEREAGDESGGARAGHAQVSATPEAWRQRGPRGGRPPPPPPPPG